MRCGVLLLAILLSGCADTGGSGPVRDTPVSEQDDEPPVPAWDWDAGIPVPRWSVGDWWLYHVEYASGETYDAHVVVHAEDGAHYHVTADDRELLLRSGITHYPTFGAVGKSGMKQSIHGAEVEYLRFPMKNGTWSAPYRDFTGDYSTTYALLEAGDEVVPGFRTTMADAADGSFRFSHGWSPVTRWFTDFTFDFDGVDPPDVVYTLQDWGSDFTGTLPLVELIDRVHRVFPTLAAAPPAGAPAQPPPAQETITVEQDGASLLVAMFAGAGGPGKFDFNVGPASAPQEGYAMEWRPTGPGGHFAWREHADVPRGEWGVLGAGAAQGFAFLFGEVYEVRTSETSLGG